MSRQLPRLPEALARAVRQLLRREALRLGRRADLQAVLVGAGEEEDVVAEQAVPAGDSASAMTVV